MATVKVSEAIRLVTAAGWRFHHQTGSHRHYTHPTRPGIVTIAGKPSATLPHKTWARIRQQAGI